VRPDGSFPHKSLYVCMYVCMHVCMSAVSDHDTDNKSFAHLTSSDSQDPRHSGRTGAGALSVACTGMGRISSVQSYQFTPSCALALVWAGTSQSVRWGSGQASGLANGLRISTPPFFGARGCSNRPFPPPPPPPSPPHRRIPRRRSPPVSPRHGPPGPRFSHLRLMFSRRRSRRHPDLGRFHP
jgi:hypothetical protein